MTTDPATLEAELLRCQRWLDSPASTGKRVDGFSEVAWCRWAIVTIRELQGRVELSGQDLDARIHSICSELGGLVEGRPTSSINYLQRIRQLRRAERALAALGIDASGAE